jgi:hypothetical protein
MAASVASTFGPAFVVGARRPVGFRGRAKVDRAKVDRARLDRARAVEQTVGARVAEFAPAARPPRSAQQARPPQPMRRRFEADVPEVASPVTRRARRIERPVAGRGRVRPRVRRSRARAASYCGPTASSRIRITRRGRVLLLVLAAVAVYAAFGLGRASAGAAHTPPHASTVVVSPGDSLWSIAVREFPNSDPRDVVGELKSLNHLSTAGLAAGQKLRLP